ncbi:hypothetical protein Tco_1564918 [Tanacetum coccineum]
MDFLSAQVNNVAKNLPTELKHSFDSTASVIPKIVFDAIAQQLPDLLTAMLKDTLPQALTSAVRDTLPDFRKHIQKEIKKKIPKVVLKPLYKEFNALNKEGPLTLEEAKLKMEEIQRLADLKAMKEKFEKKLKRVLTP